MISADGVHRVELVTRRGCHLCEDARRTVDDVVTRLGLTWRELSIDDDAQLRARFAEEVPVLMIDGVQRDFWVIDPDRLERLLKP
ncbi:glutaredoxin family protein [Zhihengliuella halotolerans]|uniref:Glutaredoxin n=1 Tax=Zhihengliuella halotolerans TaxID=370736 RepID=A0A4Q8AF95_9MICC|nr:glutaredoxin family protein [Zhihengliuella halotolerans]RZU62343.1 glutaredoxin [Zhihengliuella halotolerans]